MSVLVDLSSTGDFWSRDPDLTPPQEALVKGLVRRQRPLVGGLRIVGPVVSTTSGGSPTSTSKIQWVGTLGVLLEDANSDDVAYGITSLHVLEMGAAQAGKTLQLGHPVSQPMQGYASGIAAALTRIGWLIAMFEPLDVALIGIRPGTRWKPEIREIGETQGGQPFVDDFHPAPQTGSPGPRTVQSWSFDPEPVMGSLPTSGPPVRKVGQRTGLTSGRAYRLTASTAKYSPVLRSSADGGTGTHDAVWQLLKGRYLADPDLRDLVPLSQAIDPVLYLCVPAQVGTSTGMTTFQQTGDSGSALVDEDGKVVGIINDVQTTGVATKNWIAGLAVPIDLVVGALQEAFDVHYGKTGAPDWPQLQVPTVPRGTAAVRRVPKSPEPKWYQLASSDIAKAP